ncbi:MAG TPA: hypothetical protein VMX35_04860 [Acidobacteriota bacterium]|nr:hypothetical protein [Acidobacteriota bacterium]
MPKSTQPFRPETRPGKVAAKTLAGALVSLVVLAAFFYLLFFPVAPASGGFKRIPEPPRFYLSALSGNLVIVTPEDDAADEIPVNTGDDLLPANRYRCERNGLALIRSTVDELEAILLPGSTLRVVDKSSGTNKDLILEEGTIRLRMPGSPGGKGLIVGAPGHKLELEQPSSVRLQVREDSLRLEVFSGLASLVEDSASGREMSYPAGTIVEADLESAEPQQGILLRAPEPVSPVAGSIFLREGQERLDIDFRWRRVERATSYRAQVATDLLFARLITTRQSSNLNFALAGLAEGRYYWRVEALGRGDARSEPAGPWPFTVRSAEMGRAEIPAAPTLSLGRITAQSNLITILGQTEPGAKVKIRLEADGRAIPSERRVIVAPDGSFRHQQPVDVRGIITVVVTAYYRPENVATVTGEVRVDF